MRTKRGSLLACLLAGVVLATGVGLWAADGESEKERKAYCWGAWEEESGPDVLSQRMLDRNDGERTAKQSARPSKGRAQADCTLSLTWRKGPYADGAEPQEVERRVEATYLRLPDADLRRKEWIEAWFDGESVPLPGGQPGLVGAGRAMVALPAACGPGGEPTVVTVVARTDEADGGESGLLRLGVREMYDLLVPVANKVMSSVGCARGATLKRDRTPLDLLPQEPIEAWGGRNVCRVPGLRSTAGKQNRPIYRVGTVGEHVQTCAVRQEQHEARFVMVSGNRLTSVFDGLPVARARYLDKLSCQGRTTYVYASFSSGKLAIPPARTAFEAFRSSVSDRLGCDAGESGGGTP